MLMNEIINMKNAELLLYWKIRMVLSAGERWQWNCVREKGNEDEWIEKVKENIKDDKNKDEKTVKAHMKQWWKQIIMMNKAHHTNILA